MKFLWFGERFRYVFVTDYCGRPGVDGTPNRRNGTVTVEIKLRF